MYFESAVTFACWLAIYLLILPGGGIYRTLAMSTAELGALAPRFATIGVNQVGSASGRAADAS